MNKRLKIFIVYHKIINENIIFNNLSSEYIKNTMIYYGVNDIYEKKIENSYGCDEILEYKLEKYNPFLQLRGYLETSSYLHIYNNNLHHDLDFIGIFQYDMIHTKAYENLDENTIYFYNLNQSIVSNNEWCGLMFPNIRNIDFLLNSYNAFFETNINKKDLENIPLSLFQTNIYPKKIFNKLCSWLNVLVTEVYPWSINPPYETHWGTMSGFMERTISIFNAIEIFLGCKYENLELNHIELLEKYHYSNSNSHFNYFDTNISTKYIEDITNKDNIDGLNFAMFKALWYKESEIDNYYYAERICINGKNGLKLGQKNIKNYRLVGFDIEAEDPRFVYFNNKLYVIFICLSIYPGQNRTIGISEFDNWYPVYLRVRDMPFNPIEKNWAPFVKNYKLYFIYNYDPLVVLSYDLNKDGICNVIYRQNNIDLPINTNENNILRGGSNLIPYKKNYYIGGCHDRLYFNGRFNHFTRIILLDVDNWKVVYVSKPIIYKYEGKELNKIENTNILYHISPNLIQDPISINRKSDNVFYLTINVCDYKTLLYEIDVNIPDECFQSYNNIGDIQNKVYNDIINITPLHI